MERKKPRKRKVGKKETKKKKGRKERGKRNYLGLNDWQFRRLRVMVVEIPGIVVEFSEQEKSGSNH